MEYALSYLKEHPHCLLYTDLLINKKGGFIYPPSSLLPMIGIERLQALCRDPETSQRTATSLIGLIFLALNILFVGLIFQNSGRSIDSDNTEPKSSRWQGDVISGWILIAILTLSFYPIVKAYTLGQIQVWINAAVAAMIWCWMTDRKAASGLLLGLICLIKPQLCLLALWGLFRKEWRFLAAFVVTAIVGYSISVGLFGLRIHFDYLNGLAFLSRHGHCYYPNQSVNGLLNRFYSLQDPGEYNNLIWLNEHFPPFNPLVYWGTLISSMVLVLTALLVPLRSSDRGGVRDFCIMILSATMASPLAWEHHYGILLPIFAVMIVPLASKGPAERRILIWLGLSYLLTSNYYKIAQTLAATPFNFLQSYLLFGALILLILLYIARPHPAHHTT